MDGLLPELPPIPEIPEVVPETEIVTVESYDNDGNLVATEEIERPNPKKVSTLALQLIQGIQTVEDVKAFLTQMVVLLSDEID